MSSSRDRTSKGGRSRRRRSSAVSASSRRRPGFIPPTGMAADVDCGEPILDVDPDEAFDFYISMMNVQLQRMLDGEMSLPAAIVSHAHNMAAGMQVYTHSLPEPSSPSELDACLEEARRMTQLMLGLIDRSMSVFDELLGRVHHVMPEELRGCYVAMRQMYEGYLRLLEDPEHRDRVLMMIRRRQAES